MVAVASGYCVKCKAKKTMVSAALSRTRNGQPMMKGRCPKCGTTMCRFIKKK